MPSYIRRCAEHSSPTDVTATGSRKPKIECGSASSGRKATAPAIRGFGQVQCKVFKFWAGSRITGIVDKWKQQAKM